MLPVSFPFKDHHGFTMFSLLKDMRAISLLSAASLTILSNMIISPALPGIEKAFAGEPHVELMTRLLVTAPSLTAAAFALLAGSLADRFGRKRQLVLGVILFTITGTAGLWLPTLNLIFVSRLLLGVSVALIMTAQTALIADYFGGPLRAHFIGLQVAASNLAGLVFVLGAGWAAGASPFLPFAIYGVGLLYLPLLCVFLKEPSRIKPTIGSSGVIGKSGWAGTLALTVFLTVASLVGFYLVPTQLPFFLVSMGYRDPTATAALQAVVTFFGGALALSQPHVAARWGRSTNLATGFGLFVVGFATLALSASFWQLLIASVLIGAATGLLFPLFIRIALDVAPLERRGFASGAITTAFFMGQFLSPLASHSIIGSIGFNFTFAATSAMFALLGCVGMVFFERLNIQRRGSKCSQSPPRKIVAPQKGRWLV